MAQNKTFNETIAHFDDNIDLVNVDPKRSITVIPALDEISSEEFQQQVDRLNQLIKKYEALYVNDVMLSRIQSRGLKDILRARIIQILSKLEKRDNNQNDKNTIIG